MQLVVWQDWTYASLFQKMRTLPPRTITILSGFSRDKSGQVASSGDLMPASRNRRPPRFTGLFTTGSAMASSAVSQMDFADDGMRTGRLLLQVLGRRSGELPLPPSEVA